MIGVNMKILSPAKINLFLQVAGKRSDGYHELCTLMCGVSLFDELGFEFDTQKTSVYCTHPDVPEDETNLAHKAAVLFFKSAGMQAHVKIGIEKKIPVGAGLGGGSSNAAAVLLTLNRYYNFPFSPPALRRLGLEIGADVPFFLSGKPAFATGIGEKLQEVPDLEAYHVLLINPGYKVSTAEVYKKFNLALTKCEKNIKSICFDIRRKDIFEFMCNDLETVTETMFPDIDRIKALLMRHGAEGALMSGSGPTVFGLFSDADQAETAYREMTQFNRKQKFLAELIVR